MIDDYHSWELLGTDSGLGAQINFVCWHQVILLSLSGVIQPGNWNLEGYCLLMIGSLDIVT